MKKSDLRAGMRVVLRNGEQFVVHTNIDVPKHGFQSVAFFANDGGYFVGARYQEDLIRINPPFKAKYDVVAVYAAPENPTLLTDSDEVGKLLWRREEIVNIPIAEAVSRLQADYPPYTTVRIVL